MTAERYWECKLCRKFTSAINKETKRPQASVLLQQQRPTLLGVIETPSSPWLLRRRTSVSSFLAAEMVQWKCGGSNVWTAITDLGTQWARHCWSRASQKCGKSGDCWAKRNMFSVIFGSQRMFRTFNGAGQKSTLDLVDYVLYRYSARVGYCLKYLVHTRMPTVSRPKIGHTCKSCKSLLQEKCLYNGVLLQKWWIDNLFGPFDIQLGSNLSSQNRLLEDISNWSSYKLWYIMPMMLWNWDHESGHNLILFKYL